MLQVWARSIVVADPGLVCQEMSMYVKPMLERFGTFRALTAQPPQGKKDPGADIASALNCESEAALGSAAACGYTGGGGSRTS